MGALALAATFGISLAVGPAKPCLTAEEAQNLVREISDAVEEIRRLEFEEPVEMEIIDGATARERFRSSIDGTDAENARHVQHAYAQLGLVPAGIDPIEEYLDLAEKDVLGYYEPGSRTFVLLSHACHEDDVRAVMVHELTHALDDQHFDLEAVKQKVGESADSATAVSALVEGSAMVVMLAYLAQRTGLAEARSTFEKEESKRAARLRRAPSFTQRSLSLPYLLGFTFLLKGKPWEWHFDGVKLADINQAYADPPRSTQQILHPEQYWNRGGVETKPLKLPDLADVLGEGWSKVAEGSIGELGLAVLVGNDLDLSAPDVLMPLRWTDEAAMGIVSDVFHHYVKGEQRVTVLATRWESEYDTQQFCRAMKGRRSTVTYGANVFIAAGDVGDKRTTLAMKAFQQMEYWYRQ